MRDLIDATHPVGPTVVTHVAKMSKTDSRDQNLVVDRYFSINDEELFFIKCVYAKIRVQYLLSWNRNKSNSQLNMFVKYHRN